jgi:hypothetical protein
MPARIMTADQKERKKETDRLYRERAKEHIKELLHNYYVDKQRDNEDYHIKRKAYRDENIDIIRTKDMDRYHAKKRADPTFHAGKRGRPRKVVEETEDPTPAL